MMKLPIEYRKAREADMGFLLQLRRDTMEMHLKKAGIHLSERQHQERILYKFKGAEIILSQNKPIGLLKTQQNEECLEIIQLQIVPECQGRGIGHHILNTLIERANDRLLPVKLSVLKQNQARFLYIKAGFSIIGESRDSLFLEKKPI